ncbi:MAG: phosphoribosyltransferase family protein [Eubacteriaceae bacterium]|nr:phosphoribosyltransferase family protein [Eubacteriaceae bacterium]
MFYEMEIAGLKRQLPLCPVTDDLYIAAFILFGDVEMTVEAAKALLEKAPDFDIILTAEAKSIPLAHEMAKQAGMNEYVIARKGTKVYMEDVIFTNVDSITTDHIQTLCIGRREADQLKGKRILIIDDVISTGESIRSLELLAHQANGNVVGKMAVLAEGDSMERPDITALKKLPTFNSDGSIKE